MSLPQPPHPTLPPGLRPTRREALALGALGVGAVALSACGAVPQPQPGAPPRRGGVLVYGATGGSLKDSLDPHFPVTVPDIARVMNLYEPLMRFDAEYRLRPALAESFTADDKSAASWTMRLRPGVTFHDGRPVTATDVLATLHRVLDPKKPAPNAVDLKMLDLNRTTALDSRTVRMRLSEPNAVLDMLFGAYGLGIVPADFTPARPIGTGPFRAAEFVPGQRSRFLRYEDYWDRPAYVDELHIYDFSDDTAKVNALLSGQIQSVDNLPTYLVDGIARQGITPLIAQTGAWTPFTMRVDAAPYSDVRVRQAMRLLVDRQQMIDQALSGFGTLGNDLYAPFDPAYAHHLPQRHRDLDQARSLLRAAGHSDLRVQLTTSTAVGSGGVEAANVFAEHARGAGVMVRVDKVDPSIFYGERYLSWPFAQDFWYTRNYLPQIGSGSMPDSPYNETHFADKEFIAAARAARAELDERKRRELLVRCQEIEYERGGYLVWAFKKQVDAYSNLVAGFVPDKGMPMSSFRFKDVYFTEEAG